MLSSSGSKQVLRSSSPSGSHRSGSGSGVDGATAKTGLGAKEMEQTLSTLHKQNFDLKLELYHRREKQAALEARVDALEREAKERDEMNDSLLRELDKRDKAVEEAIGMILALERRVEELLLERKMLLQVGDEKLPRSRVASPAVTSISQSKKSGTVTSGDSSKTPIRMPSFVSERSENTENLRSVYMAGLASESGLSLPRPAEDTPHTARIDPRLGSPALSELSESSFASVYGRGRTVEPPSTPENHPFQRDVLSRTAASEVESPTKAGTSAPRGHRRQARPRAVSAQFHTINGMMTCIPSPSQWTEGLKPAHVTPKESINPQTGKEQALIARPPTSHSQPKSKKEKREAPERVRTQGQFSSPQTLPPTPDTLSTSTLPNHETPVKDHGPDVEHNRRGLTEVNKTKTPEQSDSASPSHAAQPASATTFDSRKHYHGTERSSVAAVVTPDHRSPRSASNSAYARSPNGNNWRGDTSGYIPRHRRDSTTSSIDTWLRESLKPENTEGLSPMNSASQAHPNATNGRVSPDLFSFPTSAHGWRANTMFGPPGEKVHMNPCLKGAPVTPVVDMPDAAGTSRPTSSAVSPRSRTPINGAAAPPPPNRRSSLLARTGAPADATPETEGILQSPPRRTPSASSKVNSPPARGSRTRSNSTDVRTVNRHPPEPGLKQGRAMTVPPKQVYAPPPPNQQQQQSEDPIKQESPMHAPSKRHYPPPSQTTRPRSRGLVAFFRRSSGSADLPAPPASAPPTQTAFKPPPPRPRSQQRTSSGSEAPPPPHTGATALGMGMGIPSWVRRVSLGDAEQRLDGATPPPILRKKEDGGVNVGDVGLGDDEDGDGGVVLEPSGPLAARTPGGSGGGAPVGIPPPPPTGKSSSSSRKSWAGSTGGVVENGEGGGVSLGGSSGSGKRKWLGLARVGSLRNRGGT
ncbi:hypothetical protein VTH82DRAFT_1580 [Thermothelomyces myriococcoides]